MNKKLLENLYEIPEFRILMDEVKALRPVVPKYDWKNGGNLEEIRFKSCLQQGFDLALSVFKGDSKGDSNAG